MTTAALSEGLITPDFKVTCPGYATFYGHTFLCDKREAHGTLDLRHAIEQSCNVYFYTVGNLLKVDHDPRVRREAGPDGQDRHRSAERERESRAVHRVEDADDGREVVSGRDDFRRDRPGPGDGHADRARDDDHDRRQRRHGRHAARRARGRRRDGMADSRAAAAAIGVPVPARRASGAPRRPVDRGERHGHRGPRAHRGPGRGRQDGHRAGDLEGREGGRVRQGPGPARQQLVRVLRAASTTPRSPASSSSSTAATAPHRRCPSRSTC